MSSKVTLDDKVFQQLRRKVGKLADKQVRVGVLASKGGNEDRDGITMVELAAIHEFGSPQNGIPQRSFIRSTFESMSVRREQNRIVAKLAKAIIEDRMTVNQALEVLGTWGAARVKKQITSSDIPPPLKPATVAAKGSSKPLVDTGRLLDAINHEVD